MTRQRYTPRPYAPAATAHILDTRRCALWADMGMGKTPIVLTALNRMFLTDAQPPALVVGPLRVARDVWHDEAAKWDHLGHIEVSPIVGTEKERFAALKRDASVYTVNYENVQWLADYWGARWPYRVLVLDEATKVKNYRGSFRKSKLGNEYLQQGGGNRARALAGHAHSVVKIMIELTGTPSPNGLKNLWGQLWFIDGGRRLGRTYEAFTQRFFTTGYDGWALEPREHTQEIIQAAVKDVCLTLDPKDWFDLAEPRINNIYIDLPVKARQQYKEMEKEMYTRVADRGVEAFGAAAKTQKCLQLANGAVYVDPDADNDAHRKSKEWRAVHDRKMEALDSVISEADDDPVLVVYNFRSDLARILKAYPDDAVDLATAEGLTAFKAGRKAIGLGHPASIGHGVDGLQRVCHRIVFFGQGWDLELYDQIIGRIGPARQFQIGSNKVVQVTHILARDTVDEDVLARRTSKRSVQDLLLESAKRKGYA